MRARAAVTRLSTTAEPYSLQEKILVRLFRLPETARLLFAFRPRTQSRQHRLVGLGGDDLVMQLGRSHRRVANPQGVVRGINARVHGANPRVAVPPVHFPGPIGQVAGATLQGVIRGKAQQSDIIGFRYNDFRLPVNQLEHTSCLGNRSAAAGCDPAELASFHKTVKERRVRFEAAVDDFFDEVFHFRPFAPGEQGDGGAFD